MGYHVTHFGQGFPFEALGAGSARNNACFAFSFPYSLDEFDAKRVINNRIGIGHGTNSRETAVSCSACA